MQEANSKSCRFMAFFCWFHVSWRAAGRFIGNCKPLRGERCRWAPWNLWLPVRCGHEVKGSCDVAFAAETLLHIGFKSHLHLVIWLGLKINFFRGVDWGRPLETCQIIVGWRTWWLRAGDPRRWAAPGAWGFASSSFDTCLGPCGWCWCWPGWGLEVRAAF